MLKYLPLIWAGPACSGSLWINAIGGALRIDVFGAIENAEPLAAALRARRDGAVIGRDLVRQFGWLFFETAAAERAAVVADAIDPHFENAPLATCNQNERYFQRELLRWLLPAKSFRAAPS